MADPDVVFAQFASGPLAVLLAALGDCLSSGELLAQFGQVGGVGGEVSAGPRGRQVGVRSPYLRNARSSIITQPGSVQYEPRADVLSEADAAKMA